MINYKNIVKHSYRYLAIATALWFCISFVILHIVRNDLPLWNTTLSIYAVGPGGWLLTLGFYSIAINQLLISRRLLQRENSAGDRLAIVTLVLAAIGALLVALFPYTEKIPHNIGAAMQLLLFPLFLWFRVLLLRDTLLRSLSAFIAILCGAGVLLLLLDGFDIYPSIPMGLVEKSVIVCIATWLLCYSWCLPDGGETSPSPSGRH
jgi:hypothetical protein